MALTEAAAALIGTGVTAATAASNQAIQGKMNKKTMRFSKQMYEQQVKDNRAFWFEQQAYNTPAMQVKRLREAGINPYIAYGEGGINNVAQSATSPASPTSWNPTAPFGRYDAMFENMMKMASLKQIEAQTNKTNAEAENIKETNKTIEITNSFLPEQKRAEIDNVLSNTANTLKDIEVKCKQMDLTDAQIEKVKTEKALVDSNIIKVDAETKAIKVNTAMTASELRDGLLANKILPQGLRNIVHDLDATVESITNAIVDWFKDEPETGGEHRSGHYYK